MNGDVRVEPEAYGVLPTATSIDEHIYVFPLSSAQQRLWFLYQMDPQNTSYNIAWSIRIAGEPNVGALERSLNEIVRRHEILRTSFDVIEGNAVQIVSPPRHLPLLLEDLRNAPNPEAAIINAAQEEAGTPLNLKTGPLVRTRLLRQSETEYVLLITTHHIAFDGWSRRVLVGELGALYYAYCNGQSSPLAELPLQYADYAVWQQKLPGGAAPRTVAFLLEATTC